MSALVEDFLSYVSVERVLSENTRLAYQNDLQQYLEFCQLRKKSPLKMGLTDLRLFVGRLRRQQYSATSVSRKTSTLKQFYQFLVREGRMDSDPSELLSFSRKERKIPKTLSELEMKALIEAPSTHTEVGIRDRAILELWYATGCRISELVSLDTARLDLKANSVCVTGKGKRQRYLPIHRTAKKWCERYKKVRHEWVRRMNLVETEAFFLNRRGLRLSRQAMWKMVSQYAKSAGITRRIWPHLIRHSFATHVLKGGADLRAVQELLGHRSISTTEIYTHLDIENLKNMQSKYHPRG